MAHLTDATDAHVQRVCVAACSIQHLGSQLHDHVLPPCMTLERAGCSGVVVPWEPLVVVPLILDVVVGRALLSPEVFGIGGTVLEIETEATSLSHGLMSTRGSHETRRPHPLHQPLSWEPPHSVYTFKTELTAVGCSWNLHSHGLCGGPPRASPSPSNPGGFPQVLYFAMYNAHFVCPNF